MQAILLATLFHPSGSVNTAYKSRTEAFYSVIGRISCRLMLTGDWLLTCAHIWKCEGRLRDLVWQTTGNGLESTNILYVGEITE